MTSAPNGRLTRKIQCQDAHWVSAPPASGPMAAAPEITAPHTPKAAARYLPRKTAFTVDSVEGMMKAAPTACTARAPMSDPDASAAAARRLPPTKTTSPNRNMRLRPQRSARRPVDNSSAARTTAYRLFTHCASVRLSSRSLMIVGRATPTMVPSRTIRPSPTARTPSPSHSRLVGAGSLTTASAGLEGMFTGGPFGDCSADHRAGQAGGVWHVSSISPDETPAIALEVGRASIKWLSRVWPSVRWLAAARLVGW